MLKVDNKEMAYQPILDKELIAEGGHLITPYAYKGQLLASVETVDGKDKVFNGVPIEVKEGMDVTSLLHLPKKVQAGRIYIKKNIKGNPAKVVIYKDTGLMGGRDSEDEGEEEGTYQVVREGKTEKKKEIERDKRKMRENK